MTDGEKTKRRIRGMSKTLQHRGDWKGRGRRPENSVVKKERRQQGNETGLGKRKGANGMVLART